MSLCFPLNAGRQAGRNNYIVFKSQDWPKQGMTIGFSCGLPLAESTQ